MIKLDKLDPKVKNALEWICCFIIALVVILLIKFFIGSPTVVKQISMYPTLEQDQRLWLNRWGRTIHALPKRGEIALRFGRKNKKLCFSFCSELNLQ